LTKTEKQQIQMMAAGIRERANLKKARFSWDEEEDKFIKNEIWAYMSGFLSLAQTMDDFTAAIDKLEKQKIAEIIEDMCPYVNVN